MTSHSIGHYDLGLENMPNLMRKIIKGVRVARRRDYRRALFHGVAASVEHDPVPLPDDIATVLDIGANRGQFTVYACGRFPDAVVHAFEPLPDARSKLLTVAPHGRKIEVHDVALSSTSGTATFNVTADDDSSSLLAPSRKQVAFFPGSRATRTIETRTARLDDTISAEDLKRPLLMKLDIQGAELDALRGAHTVLQQTDLILVECSFAELYEGQPLSTDVIEFLDDQGFDLVGFFSPSVIEGQLLQADALLARRP